MRSKDQLLILNNLILSKTDILIQITCELQFKTLVNGCKYCIKLV